MTEANFILYNKYGKRGTEMMDRVVDVCTQSYRKRGKLSPAAARLCTCRIQSGYYMK